MPIKIGKKTYKTFGGATRAVQREGHTKSHAQAIVASIDRKQHPKRKRS